MNKIFFAMLSLLLPSLGYAQLDKKLEPAKWIDDIDFFSAQLQKTIPEFSERVDFTEFTTNIDQLKEAVPSYSNTEIVLELQKILGSIGDESCYIYPFQSALDYPVLPLKTYWFSKGLFICDASDTYGHLKGQRIVAINGVEIETLFEQMLPVLPGDNQELKKYNFSLYAQIPAWLSSIGAGQSQTEATLTLASGKREIVLFQPVSEYIKLKRNLAGLRKSTLSNNRHEGENYWMEYIPSQKLLHVQFLQIRDNKRGTSFKQFVNALKTTLETTDVEKLVIDNRYGGGGNGFKLKPLTDLLRENKTNNKRGKLFVLISRYTRGTVMEFTSLIELNTKAIFIGEKTGEGPNSVGDNKFIKLPNSKLSISLTHKFWPTSWDEDPRSTLVPHILIDYSVEEFKAQSDPWIEAVIAYQNSSIKQDEISIGIIEGLLGTHTIQNRKVLIYKENGGLLISMNRKPKSFFEFHSQLYWSEKGKLSTDIEDVFVHFKLSETGEVSFSHLQWKGVELK